jgi:hypothetical protein
MENMISEKLFPLRSFEIISPAPSEIFRGNQWAAKTHPWVGFEHTAVCIHVSLYSIEYIIIIPAVLYCIVKILYTVFDSIYSAGLQIWAWLID